MLNAIAAAMMALAIAIPAWAGAAEDKLLLDAAFELNIPAVKAALAKGANPNAYDGNKLAGTPLSVTALGGLDEKTKLIQAGGNRDEVARIISGKAIEVARILLVAGAKLGAHNKDILHFPISGGNAGLVTLLIENGARTKGRMSDGYTPAETAKKYNQEGIYNLLIAHGGIPVASMSTAQLALVEAAFEGDFRRMEEAAKSGAGINSFDPAKETALSAALYIGNYFSTDGIATIWWLLDHGADPNLKGNGSLPPLHKFVSDSNILLNGEKGPELKQFAEDTLARLLKAGAKISGVDETGRTPLHIAASYDNVRAAEILIKEGAKVMPRDILG